MRVIGFRRFGYYISLAMMIALIWLSLGPARLVSPPEVALAASDPVIAAAGDIACDPSNSSFNNGNGTSGSCRQKYTSDLLVNAGLAAVLPLGDIQYYCGGYQAFLQSYDLSWGRVKSITRPVVGNHEYLTSGGTDCTIANDGAAGYFNYFGSAAGDPSQGYYSYDIGTWHLIALNSNCSSAGGCGSTSPQGRWLVADLAAHTNYCTLAYWHIPLFSSGGRANSNTQSIWQTLYNYDVDVVLNGHDHIYERFAPQAPDRTLDMARGIRQFTVGSGGANHTSLTTIAANSELRNTDTYGVLKLTLHPTSYDWQFVPEAGKTFSDTGTGNCHGSGPIPTTGPSPTASRTPTLGNTPTATTAGTMFTFTPEADAYIYQTNASLNYGSATTLQTDNSPVKDFLLKFNITGINGQQIRSAKLRLYNADPSSKGGDLYRVSDNNWQENTVTWNNAPARDTNLLGSLGAVAVNNWYEINLTSLITAAGTYSLRMVSTSSDGADYSSKEGANPPQLIIETQGGPTPSATATRTLTHTPTGTATNTSTASATQMSTAISTNTFTPLPTSTNTATSTLTAAATQTASPTKTLNAPSPTASFTPTIEPSSTSTTGGMDTATATGTSSDFATATPTATETPPAADTSTPTDTPTPEPSPTTAWDSTSTSTPLPSLTPTRTNTPLPQLYVFNAVGDSYVNASSPTTNYGTATTFRIDGSPIVRTYLRFNVPVLSGTVVRVRLRIYANSNSSSGYTVNSVSNNTWSELTINYNNAPAIGNSAGSSGAFSGGTWTTVDITSPVSGNGVLNLALTTSSSTAVSLASREAGANAPQLMIEAIP